MSAEISQKFAPKEPVNLNPPVYDDMTVEELAKHDGSSEDKKCYVAIKGLIYDVSGNEAYREGGNYHAFAGKDASRALAKMETKDVSADLDGLSAKEQTTLDNWVSFFEKRYNIIGKIEETKVDEK